jgi:penicillin-binding protein 2
MRDFEIERHRLFTRRSLILGGLQAGLFGALAARMYYLQVTEGERFATLAEDNRIRTQLVAPPRGLILDRFGEKLAINEQNFRLELVPEQSGNVDAMLLRLSTFIRLDDADLRRIRRDLSRKRPFMPVLIADNLNWEQAAAIQTRLPELPGISIDIGQIRYYPHGRATAHVLGYVAAVSENDLKADADPLLSVPGVQIGKTGIEKLLDKDMRGKAGALDLEVNAHGRIMRKVEQREGVRGSTVKLTLDIQLQNYVQQRLMTERSATCVVMDTQTGAIYAFASHPTFDGNEFSRGISQANYDALIKDETTPLTNKVSTGLYAPGSTFKMVVALAALEDRHTDAAHQVTCYGAMQLGNHRFHCWKRGGHGTLNLNGAIRESCDVYFYDLASKVGIDGIASMSRRLGLGTITGLDLPGERAGLVPDREWKERTRGERWQGGETLVVSIGQGFMLTTPLQLAVMTARLVNGGYGVVPHLVKEVAGADGNKQEQTEWPSLGLNERNLRHIVAAMNSVCNDRRGTAFGSRITEKGREMGGKTGTSQVRRITMAERAAGIVRNEDRPWRHRDHALFVGYAPIDNPRYAVAVVVEHGGGGSKAAAPIARDVLLEVQRLNPAAERRAPLPVAEFIPPNPANTATSGADEEVD